MSAGTCRNENKIMQNISQLQLTVPPLHSATQRPARCQYGRVLVASFVGPSDKIGIGMEHLCSNTDIWINLRKYSVRTSQRTQSCIRNIIRLMLPVK